MPRKLVATLGATDTDTSPAPLELLDSRERPWYSPPLPSRAAPPWSNWLLAVAVVSFVIPVVVAAVTGNLAIPHNDAWSYSRTAEVFAHTGRIQLFNWGAMSLIGQIVVFWPLGASLVGQQLGVAVLGLVLLYCVYDLVGTTLPTRWAVFATLLVALWPGWASLTTSFMTDIPATTGALAALTLGRRALERDSPRIFWSSVIVGFWALAIREQMLAATACVILYGLLTLRDRQRIKAPTLLSATGLMAVGALALLKWRGSLPYGNDPHLSLAIVPLFHHLETWIPLCYFMVAFALSPAVLLTARPWNWRWQSWALALLVALIATNTWLRHLGFTTGNYLQPQGEYFQVMPVGRPVIGNTAWHLIEWLSVISGVLMAGTLAERWRNVDPVLGLFTVLTTLATLSTVNTQGIYDRYLLVLAPGLLAILLSAPRTDAATSARRWSVSPATMRALGGGALAVVAATSVALASNAFAFDIARWHVASSFASRGVDRTRIDAGLEWLGWNSPSGNVYLTPKLFGWEGLFGTKLSCVVLLPVPIESVAAEPKWTPAGTFAYRTYLFAGSSRLYAYYTHAPGCRQPS